MTFCLGILIFTGCKESFFDINENPNLPTDPVVRPSYLLPMVLKRTAEMMGTRYSWAASWSGYYGRGSQYGPSLPLENYDISPSFEQGQWINTASSYSWYDILNDAEIMERKGKEMNDLFFVGAAKVLKSIGFMYLVDMYNNVPYLDALKGDESIAPKYDNGQDIYQDLLLQLDSARNIFKTAGLLVSDETKAADVLFKGDLDRWRKLTNTQSLKLLIHQSELVPNPTIELAKIKNDGSGFIEAGQTARLSIAFANNANQVNPVYFNYVADQNGNRTDGFNRVSVYLLNRYIANNDIRYQYLFLPADAPEDPLVRWVGSPLGAPVNPAVGTSAIQSIVIGTGILKSGTDPLWLFTSVESMFLQAEAVQRGWLPGDAKATYEAAVKESFNYLGVENGGTVSNSFLQNSSANWTSAPNKLELIINQKYLALPGLNNFEAYVDYRRLGYPIDVPLSLNPSVGTLKVPLRLSYPQSEYSYNANNVNAQGNIDPQTNRIFWDVR